jgi:uncharacterized protein YqjF (DUF2071 family)
VKQIFWQTWRDLVFIHWEIDPTAIASLLPPQLEPELFEGKAYVGLVPFRMTDIRHVRLPAIPGTSSTLETNVRTYVKRKDVAKEPIPAVWFFSLEASSTLAVVAARLGFGLPYFKASMRFETRTSADGKIWISAHSDRKWPPPVPARSLVEAEFLRATTLQPARSGTLEHFLIERYALYTLRRGALWYARVAHDPYQVAPGTLLNVDTGLFTAAGLPAPHPKDKVIVHRTADVLVRIGKVVEPPRDTVLTQQSSHREACHPQKT